MKKRKRPDGFFGTGEESFVDDFDQKLQQFLLDESVSDSGRKTTNTTPLAAGKILVSTPERLR